MTLVIIVSVRHFSVMYLVYYDIVIWVQLIKLVFTVFSEIIDAVALEFLQKSIIQ